MSWHIFFSKIIKKLPAFFKSGSFIKLLFVFPCLEKMAFPLDLSSCYCTREEIRKFAEESKSIGVQYVGLCCGNAPHFLREISAVYEKPAPALKYSPEMEKHFIFGDEKKNDPYYTQTYKNKITQKWTKLLNPYLNSGVGYIVMQLELIIYRMNLCLKY